MNIPPNEVLEAAATLEAYFAKQNVKTWKLGGCASRDYCEELEVMIAKAGEVMRERCERIPDRVPIRVGNNGIWGVEVFKEIRALPGVTLEDLK